MTGILPRLFAAAPDAISGAVFLVAWIAPALAGQERIKNLLMTMLIEFIVVHSSVFYVAIASMDGSSRMKRETALLGLSAIYLLFVLAFSLGFHSTWPVLAFGWLLGSRFLHLWVTPARNSDSNLRMGALWAISVATYVLGAIATILLPLPALGMTPEIIASLHMPGSGEWISRPYTVLAFGTLYFGIQAWAKYALTDPDAVPLTGAQRPMS